MLHGNPWDLNIPLWNAGCYPWPSWIYDTFSTAGPRAAPYLESLCRHCTCILPLCLPGPRCCASVWSDRMTNHLQSASGPAGKPIRPSRHRISITHWTKFEATTTVEKGMDFDHQNTSFFLEETTWKTHSSWFQSILQSYSNGNDTSMKIVKAQRTRKPITNPLAYGQWPLSRIASTFKGKWHLIQLVLLGDLILMCKTIKTLLCTKCQHEID